MSNVRGTRSIELQFPFGLDAGSYSCKGLDVFLPDKLSTRQDEDGSTVTFFPFMVIVKSLDGEETSVWLPYWHLVLAKDGTKKRKYGQWAPFIDSTSYANLVAKAKNAGYLKLD